MKSLFREKLSETVSRDLVRVDPSTLKGAEYQPEVRQSLEGRGPLNDDVAEHGYLLNPIHIYRGIILDGEGRVLVAKNNSLKTVLAWNYNGEDAKEIERLYTRLNDTGRPFKSADKLAATMKGGPSFDEKIDAISESLQTLLTAKERDLFIEKRRSPGLVTHARKVASYAFGDTSEEVLHQVIVWLNKYDQQAPTQVYMRLGYDRDILRDAITENRLAPRTNTASAKARFEKMQRAEKKAKKAA